MGRRKWRKGPHITLLDELARQEVVFWWDKPQSKGWFLSWQFRMASQAIQNGRVIRYAMPEGSSCRFSDEDILRAERRLRTEPTLEGRQELIKLLNRIDPGRGDVHDVIDRYEGKGLY